MNTKPTPHDLLSQAISEAECAATRGEMLTEERKRELREEMGTLLLLESLRTMEILEGKT